MESGWPDQVAEGQLCAVVENPSVAHGEVRFSKRSILCASDVVGLVCLGFCRSFCGFGVG